MPVMTLTKLGKLIHSVTFYSAKIRKFQSLFFNSRKKSLAANFALAKLRKLRVITPQRSNNIFAKVLGKTWTKNP